MTENNNKLRMKVKKVEEIAVKFLHSQPESNEECNNHLLKALAKIADIVADYRGLIEIECYDIDWDTDGENVDLPKKVRIMIDSGDYSSGVVADMLSDEYGWCVNNFNYKILI